MKHWLKSISSVLVMPCFLFVFSGASFPGSVTFDFAYSVKVKNIPSGAEDVQLYFPAPVSDHAQDISDLQVKSDHDIEWKRDGKFDNKFGFLQLKKEAIPENLTLELTFRVERQSIADPEQYPQTAESRQKHLSADSLIPLNPEIQKEAQKALKTKSANEEPAKAFYDYLLSSMKYDKSGEGWGRGDALYACNAKEGNCTDFHSLFLGMCRTKDVPARFHIGFPIPKNKEEGKINGYHCWAEFHDHQKGWVPVDISEAWKNKRKSDFYYGGLDPYRVRFTTGRDVPVKVNNGRKRHLNYFIYPEVWVDGQKHEAVKTTFQFYKVAEKE